jgi:hypothetical protein
MTLNDGFDRTVSDWLDEQAGRGAPAYLDEVLSRTTRIRQRPWWSSPERWLPVDLQFSSRLMPIPRLAWALTLLAILVLAAIALLAAGVGQHRLPHFGATANGAIVFVDGGSMRLAAADGTNVRTAAALDAAAEQLTFSPDGTRLAYITTGPIPAVVVADADGSHATTVASDAAVETGSPLAWSPDSRHLAFTWLLVADKIGTIDVVDADGSNRRQVIRGPAAEAVDRFAPAWSPDGAWIAFFSTAANGIVTLNVVHPDGSDAQTLKTSQINPDLAQMAWSPDPARARIAYVAGGYVNFYDMTTETETTVDVGFWPTWSPDGSYVTAWNDGTSLYSVADLLAGKQAPTRVFPIVHGNCQDNPTLAGKAICGPAQWSPDGAWIYGIDVVGKAIVFGRVGGVSPPHTITLDHPVDLATVAAGQAGWQGVAP